MFFKRYKYDYPGSRGQERDISYVEMVVNNLRAQIVKFLWRISAQHLSTHFRKRFFAFTAIAGDIESIGNHVVWITELSTQKRRQESQVYRKRQKGIAGNRTFGGAGILMKSFVSDRSFR